MELIVRKQELRLDVNPDSKSELIKDLAIIAELYGIARPSPMILNILSEDVISAYPHLNSKEIIIAFRLASQSKIKVSLELYGKPLNAWLINQVLVSYGVYRNQQRRKNQENKLIEERRNKKRNISQCPKEISESFDQMIKNTTKKYTIR